MDAQASLDNVFEVEKTTTTTVNYKIAAPLKKCTICGRFLPKSAFYRQKDGKWGRKAQCKRCKIEYYAERHFLYRKEKKLRPGFVFGQGICLICGEIHPLVFENHHPLPDDNLVVSLCSNCHEKYQTNNQEKHMIAVLKAIENSKFLWGDFVALNKREVETNKVATSSVTKKQSK